MHDDVDGHYFTPLVLRLSSKLKMTRICLSLFSERPEYFLPYPRLVIKYIMTIAFMDTTFNRHDGTPFTISASCIFGFDKSPPIAPFLSSSHLTPSALVLFSHLSEFYLTCKGADATCNQKSSLIRCSLCSTTRGCIVIRWKLSSYLERCVMTMTGSQIPGAVILSLYQG